MVLDSTSSLTNAPGGTMLASGANALIQIGTVSGNGSMANNSNIVADGGYISIDLSGVGGSFSNTGTVIALNAGSVNIMVPSGQTITSSGANNGFRATGAGSQIRLDAGNGGTIV